jgi:hypothetical protein
MDGSGFIGCRPRQLLDRLRRGLAPLVPLFDPGKPATPVAMTMTTVHGMTSATRRGPWSGIDAGRRQQNDNVFTSFRHFRRSRRTVKRATLAGSGLGQNRLTAPWPGRVDLKGNNAYLRELRRIEMEAWQQSGGDVYRPASSNEHPRYNTAESEHFRPPQ